jgi:hypothetical protein
MKLVKTVKASKFINKKLVKEKSKLLNSQTAPFL